jgi:phosphatidylglycerol---prolipoprotein diacylglyceryl transferase
MHPVLFGFSLLGREITVKSYTCFLVLAAMTAVGLGAVVARKRGMDGRKSAACLLIGLAATMIGARLVHWLTNPSSFDGAASVLSLGRSNLSAFAGLSLGIPAAAICARKLRVNPWRLADSATPALALAAALARVGCVLNGCCCGKPTRAPWAIACPAGSGEHARQMVSGAIGLFDAPLPIHPTQMYEAIAAILGGLIALWILRRKFADGNAFLVFALWFTSFRWANRYFLSAPASLAEPHWLYPAFYAVVIALCLAGLARTGRRPQSSCSSEG